MARKPSKKKGEEDDHTFPLVPPPAPAPVTAIYEARCGEDGMVSRVGDPISEKDAIALRARGLDVVICGGDDKANRRLAQKVEIGASGDFIRHAPHVSAGIYAMPHCQPRTRPPNGHSFYETKGHKVRK